MKNKPLAIIQMSHTDLANYNLKYNCINVLKSAEDFFRKIVIASPDTEKSLVVKMFAEQNGVEYFAGDVLNINKRMFSCIKKYNTDVAVRVLINYFFLDLPLVMRQIKMLRQSAADYVSLPLDFDFRFAGDVASLTLFEKINNGLATSDNDLAAKFNPWGYAETHPEKFNIALLTEVPEYPKNVFKKTQKKYNEVWPINHDSSGLPLSPYNFALKHCSINKNTKILDIACGTGNGSNFLASRGGQITGVDIDSKSIKKAQQRFRRSNLTFHAINFFDLNYPQFYFDAIISIHTMEHIMDDDMFLKRCAYLLKTNGCLVLEVPRLKKKPFTFSKKPLATTHVREYLLEDLTKKIKKHFTPYKKMGSTRGFYVAAKHARDSLFFFCKPKNEKLNS